MSCPKCDGLVTFGGYPLAIERDEVNGEDGFWIYWESECEDCGWKGTGMQWCALSCDELEDDVELPNTKNKKRIPLL